MAEIFEVEYVSDDVKRKGSKTVPARRFVTVRAADAEQAVALADLSERRYTEKRLLEELEAARAEAKGGTIADDAHARIVAKTLKGLGTWQRVGVKRIRRAP